MNKLTPFEDHLYQIIYGLSPSYLEDSPLYNIVIDSQIKRIKEAAKVCLGWTERAIRDSYSEGWCDRDTESSHGMEVNDEYRKHWVFQWLHENNLLTKENSEQVSEIPSKTLSTDTQEPNNILGIIASNGLTCPPGEVKI